MDAYWQEIERRIQEDIRRLEAEQPIDSEGWSIMEMYLRTKFRTDSPQEKARGKSDAEVPERRMTGTNERREREKRERAARWSQRLPWVRIASLTILCALIL